ncbi:MAG TPA: hypothetical protein V6C85_02835, partial [Allocoleopsis sp.]
NKLVRYALACYTLFTARPVPNPCHVGATLENALFHFNIIFFGMRANFVVKKPSNAMEGNGLPKGK